MIRYHTADEALKSVNRNERIFIQGGAATPQRLIDALVRRHAELTGIEIIHIHTEGEASYARPEYSRSFRVNTFFIGHNLRPYIDHENVQYVPVFLSEIPALFRKGALAPDTALIHVSVPDRHGFCSLGTSVDVARAATDVAKKIIALVNPNMPRTHGDGQIHCSRFTAAVQADDPLFESDSKPLSHQETEIGKQIASLIDDGSTLQLGIGGIPNAVLRQLVHHKDLGIHTEMFSDGILPLVEKGVINGRLKKKHPGKIVSSFVLGSRRLYDFVNDNPMVAMLDAGYVNDTSVIRKNDRMIAINSAIEVDLTGQVCADSIGTSVFSGVGGQMDFMRGAALSEGGKPIIALSSATAKGISKIVPTLKTGAGVVTTRAHVHYVVTEFGIADLYGKNLVQRARALTAIAHPDHRELLGKKAVELFGK